MPNRHLNEAVRKLAWQTTDEYVVLTRKEADALWEEVSNSEDANVFVDIILAIEKVADETNHNSRGLKIAVQNAIDKLNGQPKNPDKNVTELTGNGSGSKDTG